MGDRGWAGFFMDVWGGRYSRSAMFSLLQETYFTDLIHNFEDALLDSEFNKMQMQALRRQKMISDAIAEK